MVQTQHIEPTAFFAVLHSLFADIETWVAESELRVTRSEMTLNEETYGLYSVEKLTILMHDGKMTAEVVPVGASVIGAMGRVDLAGLLDREILVFLDKGGPSLTLSIADDTHAESHTRPLYRGVDEPGWYWLESRKISRVRKLDKALFLDLLRGVSDYERQREDG